MVDTQLEAGALERLDGEGNPVVDEVVTPPAPVVLPESSGKEEVPLVSTVDLEDLGEGAADPLADDVNPLDSLEDYTKGVRPTRQQLIGAAGLYNVAMLDSTITPDSVEQMLMASNPQSVEVAPLIKRLKGEDAELDELAIKNIIASPGTTVDAKLEAIKLLHGDKTPDVNGVQRAVMSNLVGHEYMDQDEEDGDDWASVAAERTDSLPKGVELPGDSEDAVWASMKALYSKADENAGLLDYAEAMTPIGSLPTLNNTVKRIYASLGVTGEWGATWVGVGTAMQNLRKRYRAADPADKKKMAQVVMNELKHDTGLFQDSNDLVTMQILDNIFSEQLTGTDQFAFETTGKDEAQLDLEIEAATKHMLTTTQPRTPERAKAEEDINFLRKAKAGMGPQQVMDDAFNLLDLVGVGSVAKGTLSFGTKYLPKMWRRMFSAAPDMANKRLADAIANKDVAEQMGLSQADALNASLPNAGVVERGANAMVELFERQREATKMLLRQAAPVNLTADERAKALGALADEIGARTERKLAKPHVNFTSIVENPDGSSASITAVFGKTGGRGYATLRGAENAKRTMVEEVFGAGTNDVIMRWDEATQKLVEVPPNAPANMKGEFFIQAQDNRSYASVKPVWDGLNLGDDTVANLTLGAGVSRWTRAANVFDKVTQGWISTRARQAKAGQSLGLGMAKPLAELPHDKKMLLAKIVKDNEGKVLGDRDLTRLGADEQTRLAYHTFRAMDDATYEGIDQLLRNTKMRNGLMDVRVGGSRAAFVKPYERLSAQNAARQSVFNPETGAHQIMSSDDIKLLYDQGGQLGRMEHAVGDSRFMLLNGKDTRVLPIPAQGVLPRIPGHYPHLFQGNYVVYGVKNGERVALKMAATESDAAAYVARHNAVMAQRGAKGKANAFQKLDYELDGSLQSPEAFAMKLDEVMVNRGGMLFGQRSGGALGNLSPDFGAIEVDPIQALLKGFETATQSVTKGELISTMKQRLHNYLKEHKNLFIGSDTPAERLSMQNINTKFSKVKERDTAVAYMKQIELMERTPDAWRDLTRNVYQRMSHVAHEIGSNPFVAKLGLSRVTRKVEQVALSASKRAANPVNSFMSMMHGMYIAIPAVRQFMLNVAQTSVASSLHPTQAAKSWRQFAGISGAVYSRLKFLHGGERVFTDVQLQEFAKQTSKAFGMKPDEVVALVNTIVDSGLIDAVSHNSMIKEAIGDAAQRSMLTKASATEGGLAAAGRGLNAVGNIMKWPVNQLSRIGFQAGENINQIVSFLHLYNADKAKGIADLASHAYVDDLIGRTAELTGNMISEAAPQYTRSFVKPFFQWLQFQHKMVLLGLPKSVGGSTMFTGVEKARMAFTQFLLFGSEATAVTAAMHKLIETQVVEKLEAENPDDPGKFVELWRGDAAKQFMDGLIFDYSANKVMQALFGEANEDFSEFAWSKTFAPGAGADSLSERLIGLFTLNPDDVLGVQMKTASNLWNYGNTVAQVAQARWEEMDDTPFEVRAEQLMKRGGAIFLAPYGKYLTNKWATEHDVRIGQGGKMSEGFGSNIEAALATLMGLDTKDRVEFYEARARLEESYKRNPGGEIQGIADTYWQQLVDNSTKFSAEAPSEDMYDELIKNYTNDQALLLSVLGRRDKEALNDIIGKKLQAVASGDGTTSELAFVQRITKKLSNGGFGSDGPQVAAYLRHLDFIKDNPRYSVLVQNAFEEIVNEPEPQNMTTNEVEN